MPAVVLAAYLIGSIPFALMLARRWGAPICASVGSGNLGAANVMRASGVTAGVLVAALDMGKGAASVWLAARFGDGARLPAAAGLAAIVGHIYPVWLRFRGGKGVATACGVFSRADAARRAARARAVRRHGLAHAGTSRSARSLASLALPPLACALGSPRRRCCRRGRRPPLIVFRHRSNVLRLSAGTERRVGVRA